MYTATVDAGGDTKLMRLCALPAISMLKTVQASPHLVIKLKQDIGYALNLLRIAPQSPNRPMPKRLMLAGSGIVGL